MITDDDLRPETRARQRDELVAIINHDLAQGPRRKLTPLLAAASVLVVAGGLAVGVPALRSDAPAAGTEQADGRPAVRPLSAKELPVYTARCMLNYKYVEAKQVKHADGFRWADPPAKASADIWVVVRTVFGVTACGFKDKDTSTHLAWLAPQHPRSAPVVDAGGVVGTHTKSVARVTVTSGSGRPVDGVLREGFFFAPVPHVPSDGAPKGFDPKAPLGYTVRAYDADGKLLYQSPKTAGGHRKELSCRTRPGAQPKPGDCDGKFFVKSVDRANER